MKKSSNQQNLFNDDVKLFGEKFKASWDEWIEYRKERRLAKYTNIGLSKTMSHIQKISENNEETAIAIIEQSIANNWQGLFPLKNLLNGNSTSTISRTESISKW